MIVDFVHAHLQVTVEQRDRAMNIQQEVRTGVLFMVDLAGSERAAVTQVREREREKERERERERINSILNIK